MNTRVQAKNVVNNNNFKPKNTMGQNFQSNNKPQIRRTLMHSGKKEAPQGRYQNNFKKPDGPRENYNMANKQPNMDNQHHTKNINFQNTTNNKQNLNGQNRPNFGENTQNYKSNKNSYHQTQSYLKLF